MEREEKKKKTISLSCTPTEVIPKWRALTINGTLSNNLLDR